MWLASGISEVFGYMQMAGKSIELCVSYISGG